MRFAFFAALTVGCGAAGRPAAFPVPSPTPTSMLPPAGTSAPSLPRYVAVFDQLVARIEQAHTFPPRYVRDVGRSWKDDLPRLREEFAAATNRSEALVALRHLQNSLRDLHCYLDPPADEMRSWVSLGVSLWASGTASAPDIRVGEIKNPEAHGLAVGGRLVAIDGVSTAAWFAAHPFESRGLAPGNWLVDSAWHITAAELPWESVHVGDKRTLTVLQDGNEVTATLHFQRHFESAPQPDADNPPPMAKVDCDASSPIDYGAGYSVASIGVNVCIYESRKKDRPRVPIVRYVSFQYEGEAAATLRMMKADHDLLARTLKGADAVIVDLHENGGGNNPFPMLGWFSAGPWDHERVVARVLAGIDEAMLDRVFFGDEGAIAAYTKAQASGQPTITTRFLCNDGRCDGDTGKPSDLVTRVPVALIVGPGCMSSCDTFAATWSAYHLGKIVGRQSAHGYTVNRLPLHVAGPDNEDLGTLRVALSESELRAGSPIEGEPFALDWEAPVSFETRGSWVQAAVERAKALLGEGAPAPRIPR